MAMIDGAMGLIPMQTPLASQVVSKPVVTTNTVYPGQIVRLVNGEVASFASGAGPVLGVCLDYALGVADNSVTATVCTDPEMVYRVLSDAAYDIAEDGQFAIMTSNGGSTTTLLANGVLDGSSMTATQTTSTILTQVGQYPVVSPDTNQWILVKLNHLALNQIN